MDRDTFWKIIDSARKNVENVYHVAPAVTKKLQELATDEILSFLQHQYDLMGESYRWDLWAVAYILNCGCSDDGFEDFRAWLMANGGKRWETAMKTPETIGDWADPEEIDYQYEDMLSVAFHAYMAKTGEEIPFDKLTFNRPIEPVGEPWREDQLEEMYPELNKKFFTRWQNRSFYRNWLTFNDE